MSVRAHKVVDVVTEGESFSFYHITDEQIEFLTEQRFYDSLNEDCCGFTEISKQRCYDYMDEIGDNIDPSVKELIEKILEDCGDNDWVIYKCY